jgi:hypothetical protein
MKAALQTLFLDIGGQYNDWFVFVNEILVLAV